MPNARMQESSAALTEFVVGDKLNALRSPVASPVHRPTSWKAKSVFLVGFLACACPKQANIPPMGQEFAGSTTNVPTLGP
jgi:hypothetical protein